MTQSKSESGFMLERLVFFSDAVFAIAITLLVLDLRLPGDGRGVFDLTPMIPKLIGFGVSFWVIGLYWLSHHRLFGALQAEDSAVRVVNLMFLAGIVFLPFPTSVIAEYSTTGDSVRFYALCLAGAGLLLTALILVARRPSLLRPGQTRGQTLRLALSAAAAPLVFLATAATAGAHPGLAMRCWLLVIPARMGASWLGGLLQRKVDGAAAA